MGGEASLKLRDGAVCFDAAAGGDVGQSALRVIDQQPMDALALQAVVVVQPVGVDQRNVALTVLGSAARSRCVNGSRRWTGGQSVMT